MNIKIIIKILILMAFGAAPYLLVKCHYTFSGDTNYYKSVSKANHLILGLSRAKRGLSPAIFKEELSLDGQMINFAFNNLQSPYGPDYLNAIQRKVIKTERKGVFILSVTPGSLLEKGMENKGNKLREQSFFFYDLWCQNCQPNLEYLIKSPVKGGPLFKYLRTNFKDIIHFRSANHREILHKDGWSELPPQQRFEQLGHRFSSSQFIRSDLRERYLKKTITFLQQHGKVYLVRLPIAETYQQYEEEMIPGFDAIIEEIAEEYQVDYLNFCTKTDGVKFIDGHHLSGAGARTISTRVAKSIHSKFVN